MGIDHVLGLGKIRFWILMGSIGLASIAEAQISFEVVQTAPDYSPISGPQVGIVARVLSEFEIKDVIANVDGSEIALEFDPNAFSEFIIQKGGWVGTVSLNLEDGPDYEGFVTATDILGNSAVSNPFSFTIDRRPILEVLAPISRNLVATKSVRVQASCDDDQENCRLEIEISDNDRFWDPIVLEYPSSEIDEIIDFSELDQAIRYMRIKAIDSRGQVDFRDFVITVEGNPRLRSIEAVPGTIVDFNESRVLYVGGMGEDSVIGIFDRESNEVVFGLGDLDGVVGSAFLSPKGAIFTLTLGSSLTTRVIEISDFEVLDLGVHPDADSSLKVEGNYAIWSNSKTLYLRNLLEGTNEIVSENAGNHNNDLDSNGVVAYWEVETLENQQGFSHQIFSYENGKSHQLTKTEELWSTLPLTDGRNVVFARQTPCCHDEKFTIVLHNGAEEFVLTPESSEDLHPDFSYAIEEGWVAYVQEGSTGQQQVWGMEVGEPPVQRSIFNSRSEYIQISNQGEIVFENRGDKYISFPDGNYRNLGRYSGNTVWKNERWYVVLANNLFRLDIGRELAVRNLVHMRDENGEHRIEFERMSDAPLILQSSGNLVDWIDIRLLGPTESSVSLGKIDASSMQEIYFRILSQ